MPEFKIRPSTTLVKATYVFAFLIAAVILYFGYKAETYYWTAAFLLPLFMLASAASKHLRTRFTVMEISGDRMKYESGIASKTTRSIPLQKVQDVTVKQTFGQRILGLGDLTIETAGEASRLTIEEINSPRVIAEQILDRVAQLNPNKK